MAPVITVPLITDLLVTALLVLILLITGLLISLLPSVVRSMGFAYDLPKVKTGIVRNFSPTFTSFESRNHFSEAVARALASKFAFSKSPKPSPISASCFLSVSTETPV